MIGRALLVFLVLWAVSVAAAVVLGAPRYIVLGSWRQRKVAKRPDA